MPSKKGRFLVTYVVLLMMISGFSTVNILGTNAKGNPVTPSSPGSGDILTGTVNFTCDSNNADSVELRIDGILIATMSGGPGWYYEINTSGWADGAHIVRYDSKGDVSDNIVSIPVKFDNRGPTISNATTLYPAGQLHAKPDDQVTITAKVVESVSSLDSVTCDASMIGGGASLAMHDDGFHNDGAPDDDVYGTEPFNVTSGGGYRAAYVHALDTQGNLRNVTASCNVDMYEPTILEIDTMLPAGQNAVKNGDQVRVNAKVLDYKILIEQQIERKPLDVVLVLDNSGSMAGANGSGGMRWDDLEYAATTFIDSLAEDDRCAVIGFDLQGGWPFEDPKQYSTFLLMSDTYNDPMGGAYTSSGRNVSKYIITADDGIHLTRTNGAPGCNTPIWDSMGTAIQYGINNRRADAVPLVIALTDGDDTVGMNGFEEGSETYCPGSPAGDSGRTWAVSGGCVWDSPVRTYPSIERERDTDPFNQRTTITFTGGQPERTRTGLLNASIPVFTIGLGINPQGSNATAGNYLSPQENSYRYTTEFDLYHIANSSVGGKYYFAPSSTDLYEIYDDVSQVIQTFGTENLGIEQPRGIGSMQTDFASIGIALKVNMFDDGMHADGKAEDSIYGSEIVAVNSLDTGNIVFLVEATDKAGNTNGTQYTIKLDNVQPTVSSVNTSYPPGRDRAQDGYSIYVSANCSDGETGLGHVYLDASNIGGSSQVPMRDDGGGNDEYAYDGFYTSENVTIATGLVSGVYTYTVNAYDEANNIGSQSGNIEIFNDVDIIMENLANGDVISGNYDLVTNITDPDGIPDGAANPRFRVDANAWFDMTLISGTRFGGTMDTSLYSDGAHTLYLNAKDPYGAESTLEKSFIIDNANPSEALISTPISNEYIEGIYPFRVTAKDAIGIDHVNITIINDTGAEVVSNSSLGYNADTGFYEMSLASSNLPDGTYRATGYAWDGADHVRVSAQRRFHVDNNAPSMSIIEPRDGQIVSGNVLMNITVDEVFLDSLEYNVDSIGWRDSSVLWNTTSIADGVHSLRIRASDGAGHESSELLSVTVDNHDPECRLSLPARDQYIGGVYTIGAIASDEVGLRKVEAVINDTGSGDEVLNVTMSYNAGTGYYECIFDTTSVADGNYTAVISAEDLAGNITLSASVDFRVDNNAPTISIRSPKEGDVVSGQVQLDIHVSDEPFLRTLLYNVDSAGWVNVSEPWNTTAMEDGDHIIDIKGTDLAGHETSGRIKVIVDNNDPEAHIISPASGEYVSGTFVFKVSGTDEVGIESVLMHMFSQNLTATYNTQSSCYEVVVDTEIWGDGSDFISVDITDRSGKSISIGPRQFHVDNNRPEFDIHDPSDGDYVEGTIPIALNVRDNFADLCRCEFNVDGKGWVRLLEDAPNSSFDYTRFAALWNTAELADGVHSVVLRATDLAGHVTTYSMSVFVDNSAPVCEIHTPRENQYMEGVVTFKVKADDDVGISRVVLDLFGKEINATFNTQTGYYEFETDTTVILEDGIQSITATAIDRSMKASSDGPVNFNLDNTPPKLVINSPRSGMILNGSVTMNITNLDSYPVPTEYNVDSAGWRDVGVPWDTTEIDDGIHAVAIRARDAIGHEVSETIIVTVDNNLPTCILHVPSPGQFFEDQMTLKVLATDRLGIERITLSLFSGSPYERTVDAIHNSVSNYYEFTQPLGGVMDGSYKVRVTAIDRSANTVTLADVQFHVDSNPPALRIRKPVSGEYITGLTEINVSSLDAFETRAEYNLDRSGWNSIALGGQTLLDTTEYADGPHTLEIRTSDEAGHITQRELTVYVDNSLPHLSFVNPGRGDHLTGTNTIKVYCYDAIAVHSVDMTVGNGSTKSVYVNPITGLYETPLDTTQYPDGDHIILITVRDRVGNSNSAMVRVSFNNMGPDVDMGGLPRKGDDNVEFRVDNAENASRMYINIGGTGWKEMGYDDATNEFWYMWSTDSGDNGKHTYQIKAVDEYGNERVRTGVIEVDNPKPFLSSFADALPLILFILLLLFLIIVVFILIRTGHARRWIRGDPKAEKDEKRVKAAPVKGKDRGKGGKRSGKGRMKEPGINIMTEDLENGDVTDEEEEQFECPDCGTALKAEDNVCPKCGAEFEDEDDEDGAALIRGPGDKGEKGGRGERGVPKRGSVIGWKESGGITGGGRYREAAEEMDKVGGWVEDGMDVRSLEAGLDDDGWMEVEEEGEGVGSKGGDEVRKSGGKKKGTDKKGRKWSRDGQYRVAAEDVEEMGGWIEEDDFYD